jgi:hypothetical protein
MTKDTALKLALKALLASEPNYLLSANGHQAEQFHSIAISAVRQAMAQKADDSVAVVIDYIDAKDAIVRFDSTRSGLPSIGSELFAAQPGNNSLTPVPPFTLTRQEFELFKLGWFESEAAHGIVMSDIDATMAEVLGAL